MRLGTEHFPDQSWVDFVRGIGLPSTTEIEAHLRAGCPECKTAVDLWKGVGSFAAKEGDFAPPENLVRLVKLELAGQAAAISEPWTIAGMVFDSAMRPLPAGIRSAAVTTRQVVYEGEGLTVDVRFERHPNSNRISAAGQVLDQQVPLRWLGNAAIVLWADGGQMLATTEANDYGEFQFEFESQDQLRISIATAGRRTLRIPLGSLR
jgi:hypothetical protein